VPVSSDGLDMLGFRRSLQVPWLATPFLFSNVAMIVTAIVSESIHRITLASALQKGDADDSFVDDHRDLRRFAFLPHTGATGSPCSDCIAKRGIWKGRLAAEQKHARLSMFELAGRSPRYRAAIAEYIPDQAMVD